VPFSIRAGKCLPVTCTEVVIEFHRPPQQRSGGHEPHPARNYERFRFGPEG
jgi:glucose-6-phosphate 1-dehydrogenase